MLRMKGESHFVQGEFRVAPSRGRRLVFKFTAADELAQNRGARDVLFGNHLEISQEFQQAVSFGELDAVFGHGGQNRDGILFKHTHLADERGVEHGIGILLEGEDVAVFATTHTGPATDGLLCRIATVVVVTYNSSYQSVIGSWNGVLLVNGDTSEGGYKKLELDVVVDLVGQTRVQAVNSLNHHDGVRFQFDGVAFPKFLSLGEIKGG